MNKIYEHKKICDELNETYKKKNADYGDSVGELYAKLGDITLLTRISDKYNRLMNLLDPNNDREVNYESVDDTILDMANYCIIWLMERRVKNFKCIMDKINQSNSEIKIEDEPVTNSFGSFKDLADTLKENITLLSKDDERANYKSDVKHISEEEMLNFIKETRENLKEVYRYL